MPRWLDIELLRKEAITPHTSLFYFAYKDTEKLMWKAGQYVTMDLPVGTKRIDKWRSYSIANNPNSENVLEFCIVKVPEGRATSYLFDELVPGQLVQIKKPAGVFVLPKNLDRNLVMICTGTGVAPFKSMLEHIIQQGLLFKNIHLIFGARTKNDILYHDFFTEVSDAYPHFKYDIALSREPCNGYQGYVHGLYKEQYQDVSDNTLFYLCGWQNMIDEAEDILLNKMGYPRNQIITELYG